MATVIPTNRWFIYSRPLVGALIAMVAVGQGANEAVRKQIESLGTNLLVVQPGAVTSSGARGEV